MLYLAMTQHENGWDVAFVSKDKARAEAKYMALDAEKVMAVWSVLKGVEIIRIRFRGIEYNDTCKNVEVPFLALPDELRLGMEAPLCLAVIEFLKMAG